MIDEADDAFATYQQFLEAGMAKETARLNLPLSTYTHWVTTWDLHNLLHMLELRLDPHAQWEIRQYAEAIWTIVKAWCPLAAEAFVDFRLEAATFSRQELAMVRDIVSDWKSMQDDLAASENKDPDVQLEAILVEMLERHQVGSARERTAFLKKLELV
jgi:thymidylate synthase (FAD)